MVLPKIEVDMDLKGLCEGSGSYPHLAYMWADKRVKEYLGAPIYADDAYRLPAAPWVKRLYDL